jgi:hypothetical protein
VVIRIENCRLLSFPKISDPRGCLSYIEGSKHVPFEIRRVFYLYDVPAGQTRGGHAHRELHQVLVAVAGHFEVLVDDGVTERQFRLCHPSVGLYVPPLIWDTEVNFSPGAVCMVLASDEYDESDYYRERGEYLKAVESVRELA